MGKKNNYKNTGSFNNSDQTHTSKSNLNRKINKHFLSTNHNNKSNFKTNRNNLNFNFNQFIINMLNLFNWKLFIIIILFIITILTVYSHSTKQITIKHSDEYENQIMNHNNDNHNNNEDYDNQILNENNLKEQNLINNPIDTTDTVSLTATMNDNDHHYYYYHDHTIMDQTKYQLSTVTIGILVRNKAHTLPYFLNGIEKQNYPKNRIQIIFLLDNTIDNSETILIEWINQVKNQYHNIILDKNNNSNNLSEFKMWSNEHYEHIIKLRQKLLDYARKTWSDFYFSIDADIILINMNTLNYLIEKSLKPPKEIIERNQSLTILGPLINCTNSEFYSNFWGSMSENGYYQRSEHYFDILGRHQQGLFPVAMIHSIFLINLKHFLSQYVNYDPVPSNYHGPQDDIIIFARSVQSNNLNFFIDNTQFYGYLLAPIEEDDLNNDENFIEKWLQREKDLFTHLRLQAIIDLQGKQFVEPSKYLLNEVEKQLPKLSKLNFDEIYFINLLRRPDRRVIMDYIFKQLGIDAKHIPAVDGKSLTPEIVNDLNIKQLPGYADPYHKRSLKFGEIGCFLSHFNLWKEMIEKGYEQILILEDDLRFSPSFISNLQNVLKEANENHPDWDLLYIGRKRMSKTEKRVPNTKNLAYPDYTYWTLGYILNRSGAKKLLDQKPLQKMVAVDEYLPIMFNRHPRKDWLDQFEPRNLIALSAEPLLIEPQRYTGEKFYVSDTEDSDVLHGNIQL